MAVTSQRLGGGTDDMAASDRIHIDPKIMDGKPVIRGTSVQVELVLRKLAEGATVGELLDGYPSLTPEDIEAAKAWQQNGLSR
jgi:uncharacterized protein (DUF433 family)